MTCNPLIGGDGEQAKLAAARETTRVRAIACCRDIIPAKQGEDDIFNFHHFALETLAFRPG